MSFKAQLGRPGARPVLGAFLGLPVPALVEVMGRVGFDFVVLDGEHGVFSPEQREECLRAAGAVNLPAIVRLPDSNPCNVQFALDAGAQGVQVPSVETPDQARMIVDASRFPPRGRRGFGSTTRAAGYGFVPRSDVVRKAYEEVIVVIQIETRKGIDNLGDILAVDGVDVVFLGTSDLSLDYGHESPSDPALLPLLKDAMGTIRRSGKVCGLHVADWNQLPEMKGLGAGYFTVAGLTVMGRALRRVVEEFDEVVAR